MAGAAPERLAFILDEPDPSGGEYRVPEARLRFPPGHVVARSAPMRELHRLLAELAPSDDPVLLVGETGVGKDHVARILHLSSPRRAAPFVPVNCAALPRELMEAEMFGVGENVATGVGKRPGRFATAEGGTLLLDEIGVLEPRLQAKLLRALEIHEIQVLGEPSRTVDVRSVAATNADLSALIDVGDFRADLYYRLARHEVRVPPLRECREDVPRFLEHFLGRAARGTGKRIVGVTVTALEVLTSHAWPGNVRELENEAYRLFHRCPHGRAIEATMVSEHIRARSTLRESSNGHRPPPSNGLRGQVRALERRLILDALRESGGNRSRAAQRLGIHRNSLAAKIESLGIGPHELLP